MKGIGNCKYEENIPLIVDIIASFKDESGINKYSKRLDIMLPIYNAISIEFKAIHSGTSKPCIMTVEDDSNNIVGNYVVKIFRPEDRGDGSDTSHHTNREVYGSLLAKEFDFKTPDAVLVKVNQNLIETLNNSPEYRNSNLVKGTYFATIFMEGIYDYSETIKLKVEDWEIENIFAFDVLIRNLDRRKKKPNLFIKDDEIYLIDHEMAFATIDIDFQKMVKEWEKYWNFIEIKKVDYQTEHLFLQKLRQINSKNSVNFDTFREYLRRLDLDVIINSQIQLKNIGNNIEDDVKIITYLKEVKNNEDLFIQLLKDLIA